MRPLDLPNPREARPESSEGRGRFSETLNTYKRGHSTQRFEYPMFRRSDDMTPHQRVLETIRQSRKTSIVAAAYILAGFVLAATSIFSGDRLGAFLGFVIISGALAFALLLGVVLRVGLRISNLTEHVDAIREKLVHRENLPVEKTCQPDATSPDHPAKMLDLASMGSGDPSELTAATLDRSRFPRLVATMKAQPPAQVYDPMADISQQNDPAGTGLNHGKESSHAQGVTVKNLFRTWKSAVRDGDLLTCRSVFSTMVDVTGPDQLEQLHRSMEKLADQKENEWRRRFSESLRRQDYAEMLEIGERICSLLPDRPVSQEFVRIKPYLLRRMGRLADSDVPTLKVAP